MNATVIFTAKDSRNSAEIVGNFVEDARLKARVQKRANVLCKWLQKDISARIVSGSVQLLVDNPGEYCSAIVYGE